MSERYILAASDLQPTTDGNEGSREPLAVGLKHVAFLSSLSRGLEKLRVHLHKECRGQLWVAEENRPELKTKHPLEIVDVCVEALKASEIFICVLGGTSRATRTGGTAIEVDGLETRVSYFEIEVFQAALSQIPVVLLYLSDFSPGPRMDAFLRVLERCSIVTRRITGLPSNNQARIIKEVRAAIAERTHLRLKASRQLDTAASDLATRLVSKRGKLRDVGAGGTDMLWMHGDAISEPAGDQAVLNRALTFLQIARSEKRHDKRLSRLYVAFRELMTMPYQHTLEPDVLSAWNSGFGLWCGSAAWYGLHNHVAMGVISGLWSQHVVRELLRHHSSGSDSNPELRRPFGALASAYLSLSKMCSSRLWRRRVTQAGIALATRVVETGADDDPGIYAVRGSLFFVQLNPLRAMSDFRQLLSRARKQPSNIGLNAEAHTYIGRGYALTHRRVKAREHLTEAVRLWERHVQETHAGEEFLVKAMKHLLAFQVQTRQFEHASITAANALRIARSSGVYDQARQIEEILRSNHPLGS